MNSRSPAPRLIFAAGVLSLLACSPAKYTEYRSLHRDFKASVPWGWQVMTDEEGAHFANTTFIGPFEPEFYLGAPSLSVRWYAYSYPHRLRDGTIEIYTSAEDYVKRTLKTVYAPEYKLINPVQKGEGWTYDPVPEPKEILMEGGRKAMGFFVLSPVGVPAGTQWGTSYDPSTKKLAVVRLHAYVVLPLKRGFYVIVYPATRDGFKLYQPHFTELVNTFVSLKEGPDGPALEPEAAKPESAKVFPPKAAKKR